MELYRQAVAQREVLKEGGRLKLYKSHQKSLAHFSRLAAFVLFY